MPLATVLLVASASLLILAVGFAIGHAVGVRRARAARHEPRRPRSAGPRTGKGTPDPAARFQPADLANPKRLMRLPGLEFERAAAEAFRRAGFEVEETGGIGDGGVDLIVSRNGFRAVGQVKHRTSGRPVTVHGLRELHGVREDRGVAGAVFVSSSGFTVEARHYAKRHGIWLVTLNGLKEVARGGRAARPSGWEGK